MEMFFLKGIVLGFSIAAPVGPIGVLCIRRTLSYGMMNGFLTGLGAATADTVYGFVAAFGVTAVTAFLLDYQFYLRLIGGLFLLYLGYTTFRTNPAEKAAEASGDGRVGAYVSTFFLTLTNPMTIMSFAAVFAGVGLGVESASYSSAGVLVAGVFTGSMLWWLTLSKLVDVFRAKVDQRMLKWVNRLAGAIIAVLGVWSLLAS